MKALCTDRGCAASWVAALLAMFSISCGAQGPSEDAAAAEHALDIQQVTRELGQGDRGADVSAVYRYLRASGYLPNPELEARYHNWAPTVPEEADDPAVFGPAHEAAVTAYQRSSGLPESGFVDQATLASMKQPRCGNPENELALFDPSEKWDLIDPSKRVPINAQTVPWFVSNCHDNGTNFCETLKTNFDAGPSSDSNAVEAFAFGVWQKETNKIFSRMSSCVEPCVPAIDIRYYSDANKDPNSPNFTLDVNGWPKFGSTTILASTQEGTFGNLTIGINADAAWTVDKLRSTLAHEIGHALGLEHSALDPNAPLTGSTGAPIVSPFTFCDNRTLPCKTVAGGARTFTAGAQFRALMGPSWLVDSSGNDSVNNPQTLTVDDRLAVTTLLGTWHQLNGLATDVAVGGTTVTAPQVWVTSGNNTVWKLSNAGSAFNQDTSSNANGTAVAATPSGIPWTVASTGQVRSRSGADCSTNPCTGTWTNRGSTNTARDIGIGGTSDTLCSDNGTSHPCVWIISTTASGSNFQVRRWDGSSFVAPGNTFQGVRLTVDRSGFPIVVTADHTIFTSASRTGSATWTQVKGVAPGPVGCANDVAAGFNGGVYIAGCQSAGSGNFDVWTLGINVANVIKQNQTFNHQVWWPLDGFAARVAVGPDGRAIVVQATSGAVFRRDAK
jgi:hypothetical protein